MSALRWRNVASLSNASNRALKETQCERLHYLGKRLQTTWCVVSENISSAYIYRSAAAHERVFGIVRELDNHWSTRNSCRDALENKKMPGNRWSRGSQTFAHHCTGNDFHSSQSKHFVTLPGKSRCEFSFHMKPIPRTAAVAHWRWWANICCNFQRRLQVMPKKPVSKISVCSLFRQQAQGWPECENVRSPF